MIVRLIIIIFSVLLFQLAAPSPPVDYFNFCKNKFASLLLSMLKPMCCLQCCCHCCKAADWLCIYKTISFLCSVVSSCCCCHCWSIVASFTKQTLVAGTATAQVCCAVSTATAVGNKWYIVPSTKNSLSLSCFFCLLSPPLLSQPVDCCFLLFTERTLLLLLSLQMRAATH